MPKRINIPLDRLESRADSFDVEMGQRFQLPPSGVDPLYSDGLHLVDGEPDAKRMEQVVTHLQLLGYLPEEESLGQSVIDEGLARWEEDFREGKKKRHFTISLEGERTRSVPWDSIRLRYLKATATFEGEVRLLKLPTRGQVTLASRIANMRLVVYGLSRAISSETTQEDDLIRPDSPYEVQSSLCARAGANLLYGDESQASILSVLNLLGHAPAATDAFLARHGKRRFLFREKDEINAPYKLGRYKDKGLIRAWEARWSEGSSGWRLSDSEAVDLKSLPKLYDAPLGSDRAKVLDLLSQNERSTLNVFALELLQLRLWMLGYYHGEVDGKWGAFTERALEHFVDDHSKAFRFFRSAVRPGWNGWNVVNVYRIFAYIVDYLDAPSERMSISEMNQIAEGAAAELRNPDWKKVEKNYQEYREEQAEVAMEPAFEDGAFRNPRKKRKRYFGWRRFFSAIGSFFRGIGKKIIDAVKSVASALRQGVKQAFNIFRYVWRKARIAMRVARLALKRLQCWLFSKPFGTARDGEFVATRWSLDYDTIHYVSPGCSAGTQKLHARRINWMNRSFSFMCDLGSLVFKFIAGSAIGAWLKVAYQLYKKIREMLRDPDYKGLFSEDLLEQGMV